MKLFITTKRLSNKSSIADRKWEKHMPHWSQHDLHSHMHVYSSDNQDIGHIAEVYEDSFLVHKGYFFPKDRYIPYSAIANVENDHVQLTMSADEAKNMEWEKRPDYEHHLGDPEQLFYDRGHGVSDPFDESNPDRTWITLWERV